MRKSFRKGLALLLAAALAFGTPVLADKTVVRAEDSDGEVAEETTGAVITDTVYEEGYVVDASEGWNSKGGPAIGILEGMTTVVTFENEPFIRDGDNWSNFVLETNVPTGYQGVTLRADAFGWLYDSGLEPTFEAVKSWGDDWSNWANISPGLVELRVSKDINNVVFDILFESGDIETYTVKYDDGVPEDLEFYVGADGGKITLKSIEFVEQGILLTGQQAVISGNDIEIAYDLFDKSVVPDKVEVKMGEEIVSLEDGKFKYTPTKSGTYEFTITAQKAGAPDDVTTVSIAVAIENGKLLYDKNMIADLAASKTSDSYSITFSKLVQDADYKVDVQGGGNTLTVDANNSVKFTDLTSGTEYTVTVTASKDGYVTKTATTKFTYTEEKVEDAASDVKRTTINKTLGATDYSTGFWSVFDSYKIEDNKKYTFVFENHGNGTNNWNNFVLAFANQEVFANETRGDSYVEYGIVRADNYGWSMSGTASVENTTLSGKAMTFTNSITDPAAGSDDSWTEWKSIIKDSNVTMAVIRSGSEIKIEATIVSQADASKKIEWTASLNVANTNGSAPNPLYMAFTVDGAYLNLKYVDEQVSTEKLAESGESTQTPTTTTQTNSMMIKTITVTAGKKKITGTVNASNATVQVKVGSKAYKKATVSGKKFTFTAASKLKIGTKVTVKATATGYTTATKSVTVKGTMKVSSVKAKKGSKSITGKVSVKKTTVKVKVGKKKYKKAKVSGKKFTFSTSALKKGTTVKVKVTRKNYTSVTKSVKVK